MNKKINPALLVSIGCAVVSLIIVGICIIPKSQQNTQEIKKSPVTEIEVVTEEPETMVETETEKIIETETEEIETATPTPKPPVVEYTPPTTTEETTMETEATIVEPQSNESSNGALFKLTAYCNCSRCCGQWAGGPTASGTMPVQGRTIAVCNGQIPYGATVYIDGYGAYIAEDCGVGWNCIDVYMDSHAEAYAFGVKYAYVTW